MSSRRTLAPAWRPRQRGRLGLGSRKLKRWAKMISEQADWSEIVRQGSGTDNLAEWIDPFFFLVGAKPRGQRH